MNRRRPRSLDCAFNLPRARIARCIVGTAVYQVGWKAAIQSKKRGASKPGVATTLAPALSDASTAATRP